MDRPEFTPRQLQLLNMMSRGYSPYRIAEELDIRISTVRKHIDHIIRKLGAHSQIEALAKARELGVVGDEA